MPFRANALITSHDWHYRLMKRIRSLLYHKPVRKDNAMLTLTSPTEKEVEFAETIPHSPKPRRDFPRILVIDDDRTVLHLMRRIFRDAADVELVTASSAREGLALAEEHRPDVVLLDVKLPEGSGLRLFQELHQLDPKLIVIFITASGECDTAIEATKLGAYDYLIKPLDVTNVEMLVRKALEIRRLMNVPVVLPKTEMPAHRHDLLVGRSPKMQDVYKAIGRVASQDVTVLIRGESGTGKELVARAIYQHSERVKGPFLAVNCAALTETLLESELFGHEKGAFTGADQRRIGKFEQCSGGTIFLDEVGDMSLVLQSKVLRLLQDQQFERVGGNQTIQTDVRIIAATNRNLEKMVADGTFRSDLYYRLNGYMIHLPAVRERGEDLLLLIQYFLSNYSREMGQDAPSFSAEALVLMQQYPWPGNVRELQAVIRQTLLHTTGAVILPDFLPESIQSGSQVQKSETMPESNSPPDLQTFVQSRLESGTSNLYAESVEWLERFLLPRVLDFTDGNQSHAAKLLGISRGNLRAKIRSLHIPVIRIIDLNHHEPAPVAKQA